ncbi:MAG TPA: hypothetical protein VMW41_05165 [Candidatus Bathyarchaeia archaeon]|nr:hypothetical protein [Candidatus Bathyarchaeia archaeon]
MAFEKLDFLSEEKRRKTKKTFSEKIIALALIFVAFVIAFYFYERGEVSFLSRKEETAISKTIEVQIPIGDKEYKLSYRDAAASSFDIASFEENEDWSGDKEFDYATFYEGVSSLFITSNDGKKAITSLKKRFNIEDVLNFKFIVYLATDYASIEEFNLVFVSENVGYKFPISGLSQGWNLLVLSKEKFSTYTIENKEEGESEIGTDIREIVIELTSRPKTRSTVNLDTLWAEKEEDYLNDWNVDSDKFLSIRKEGGLLAVGMFGKRATLKKGSVKNGTFQAKLTPMKNGEFSLFFRGDYKSGYGYYLIVGGIDTNTWRINKYGLFEGKTQNLNLSKGKITSFEMEKDQPYWLKVEMKENRLIFYFSMNGIDFIKLSEVNDTSFPRGGIGIAASSEAMFFVDDLQFFQ